MPFRFADLDLRRDGARERCRPGPLIQAEGEWLPRPSKSTGLDPRFPDTSDQCRYAPLQESSRAVAPAAAVTQWRHDNAEQRRSRLERARRRPPVSSPCTIPRHKAVRRSGSAARASSLIDANGGALYRRPVGTVEQHRPATAVTSWPKQRAIRCASWALPPATPAAPTPRPSSWPTAAVAHHLSADQPLLLHLRRRRVHGLQYQAGAALLEADGQAEEGPR